MLGETLVLVGRWGFITRTEEGLYLKEYGSQKQDLKLFMSKTENLNITFWIKFKFVIGK